MILVFWRNIVYLYPILGGNTAALVHPPGKRNGMADRNEKVMAEVEQRLQRAPDISSRELYEKAQEMDSSIGDLTLRQFNASYVLPFKRKRAARRKSGGSKKKAASTRASSSSTPRGRKRSRSASAGGGGSASSGATSESRGGADRERIRGVLLDFAGDVAEADSKTDFVGVLRKMDRYIDQIEKAAG